MASPSYVESLLSSAKRLRISPPKPSSLNPSGTTTQHRCIAQSTDLSSTQPRYRQPRRNVSQLSTSNNSDLQSELRAIRLPKTVQSTYLTPLKRTPTHGIPVCDLQLRSYSVRNLELFADFCLRAAYYLNLPAKGPVPLPKITERWTVPRSNFVHKKSQENFERVTVRRLVQVQDGHPETVAVWLAYIQKNAYYGVGMKANVFEHGSLDVSKDMDESAADAEGKLKEVVGLLGGGKAVRRVGDGEMEGLLHREPFKAAWGAYGAMGGAENARGVAERFSRVPADAEERMDRKREGVKQNAGEVVEGKQEEEKA